MKQGLFIVLEGIDKSGKSTLTNELALVLQAKGIKNEEILKISFPNRNSTTGKLLDSYLKNETELKSEAQHLIFSANRWEMSDFIELERENKIIICDRYCYSGIVYSVVKGVDLEWAKNSDSGLPIPDFIFFIDIQPETVCRRNGFGNERYEKVEVQKKIYENYKNLLKDETNVYYLDGNKETKQNAEEIYKIITETKKNLL